MNFLDTAISRPLVAALVALGLVAAWIPAASAHGDGNHGTIKVHDESEASPPQRNEPHVDCEDFWVEGFKMSDSAGHLAFYSWPPTGTRAKVGEHEWDADAHDHEDGTFHFLAGPFTLGPGHFRVEVFLDSGHSGSMDHFSKAKMFWVEECEEEGDEDEERECPTGLSAVANPDGSVTLHFDSVDGSAGTNVYRAEGDGDFEYIDTVDAGVDEYTDMTTEIEKTYTYTVSALFGNEESEFCEEVTVTTIPDLPTMLAVGLALGGGLVGYAAYRRRLG